MDKVLGILKNKWFRLGVSFLSFAYLAFEIYVIWLTFAFFISPTNFTSLYATYLFINFLFAAEMFFTRKQIPTKITAVIASLLSFFLMIVAFGEWHIIIPIALVSLFAFFATNLPESVKTVLGTIFMLMFIVGGLAYTVLLNFGISLNYVVTDQEIDMSQRTEPTYLSPDGTYRLVVYVDADANSTRTVTSYFIEEAYKDEHLWFVDCYRVYGCKQVLVSVYGSQITPSWVSDSELMLDGKIRDIEALFADEEPDEDDETASISRTTTAARETEEPDETTEEATEGDE